MSISVLTQLLFVYSFYGICHTIVKKTDLASQHVENGDFKHALNVEI